MKEYTVITTVQFTEIVQADHITLVPEREVERQLKRFIYIDDIKITDRQMFIRDLPNEPEVVVGTPDLAVQGG
jgi:hypothetical protein